MREMLARWEVCPSRGACASTHLFLWIFSRLRIARLFLAWTAPGTFFWGGLRAIPLGVIGVVTGMFHGASGCRRIRSARRAAFKSCLFRGASVLHRPRMTGDMLNLRETRLQSLASPKSH
jgi:hypothetical protein